jgi:rhodanese-related sulfurtransferase
VRTSEEYADGHIPTAVNIPLAVFERDIPTQNKNALIIVYCRSGNRSGQALAILKKKGYANAANFGAATRYPAPLVPGSNP